MRKTAAAQTGTIRGWTLLFSSFLPLTQAGLPEAPGDAPSDLLRMPPPLGLGESGVTEFRAATRAPFP